MEITLKPTLKQHEAWQALRTHDIVFLGGGAGGGKSWWLCETRLINCYLYPGYKSFIGREELKRLMLSTYITWTKVCKYHGIPQDDWKLNGQYNYIEFKNGSRIDLLDLKYLPSDPLYERFGSLEYSDGAIEEAGEVHFGAYDVLKSRIGRHMNEVIKPTLAITGNPKKNWTYKEFYKPFKDGSLPDNIKFIQSLYSDNKYTADSYKKQLSSIRDKATKERLMLGNWEYDDDPNWLIESYDKLIDIFENNTKTHGRMYMSCDVARFGSDKAVIGVWNGYDIIELKTFDLSATTEIVEQIKKFQSLHTIPNSSIVIDGDGVGGGVVDMIRNSVEFHNNARPTKIRSAHEEYDNLKSQCAFDLSDKINDGLITISATISEQTRNNITEELEHLKRRLTGNKLGLISKDQIKDNIGRSPDFMDMMLMRMIFEVKPVHKTRSYGVS